MQTMTPAANTKPPVADHQKVLALRRGNSLAAVARQTGLPLGTVKAICSRSGAFRDNQALRSLCSLPPVQQSSSSALAQITLPPQVEVTGDPELDALLWLREVIKTGNPAFIANALEAVKRIKTPIDVLERKYTQHLVAQNPGSLMAAFQSIGFADLEALARSTNEKLALRHEGLARFGNVEGLFAETPAERFCIDALKGVHRKRDFGDYDASTVDARFNSRADLLPQTLDDCLFELRYWDDLYRLREADSCGDHEPEVNAREDFVLRSLARIRPRTKAEAVSVFRYLAESEFMDRKETESILLNLIG
ncbi:hypothetical protein SNE35_18800 [Paucibacter sp. R3-3]|uniref:Uncharacterized protein n=1 Tax=Roseateles agri TaxID=3098619 RepID=A0ABU5DJU5_9BURK|nr:hypothetical protein [Paucibacter sp. R3-3]MDY0746570.1 hypothetical protein [Paucibacter sp. R3-3]